MTLDCSCWFTLGFWSQATVSDVKHCIAKDSSRVHQYGEVGWTSLHWAAVHSGPDVVRALIDAGAEIHAGTKNLTLQPVGHGYIDGEGGLVLNADGITKYNTSRRSPDNFTPLHLAAANGRTENISALINAGADINARSEGSVTPLHMAAGIGQTEAVRVLIAADAEIEGQTEDGNTPLHVAARKGNVEIIRALIDAGADIYVKNDAGKIPADRASDAVRANPVYKILNPRTVHP